MPYTGSGVLGSAVGMDKLRTKQLAKAAGVATPAWILLAGAPDFERAVRELGLPLAVKPASQGSSVGMSRVENASELPTAWRAASSLDPVVIAEQWITGSEYTVGVLQGEALPAIRIETPRTFYDYQAKYFADDTRYLIPCGLSAAAEAGLQQAALATFAATGAAGWGRVDFVTGKDGVPLLLEINTVPGMTSHSLVPMAAARQGLRFPGTGVADPRNQLRAGEELNMGLLRRRNRRKPAGPRFELPEFEWQRVGSRRGRPACGHRDRDPAEVRA